MTSEKQTPPAATEGVSSSGVAGKQPNASSEHGLAQGPQFFATQGSIAPLAVFEDFACTDSVESDAGDLTIPPGLVGDIAAYVYNSARYPMKEAALLAALATMAGVVGRPYNFNGSGLNLYLLLLAPTGRGKEGMAQGISRLMSAVRPRVPLIDEFLGPAMFASGQALLRTVAKQPSFVTIQGEFGITLKNLNDPRATGAERMLRQVLLDAYGKSGQWDVLRQRTYADDGKDLPSIQSPCVTILGESTPGHVFDSLGFRDVEDGLLPRCLILECTDERPRQNPHAGQPPAPGVVGMLADLATHSLQLRHGERYHDVPATPQARALLQRITDELDDAYNDSAAPAERALWNRAGLNIGRVATLIAIGCDPYHPMIQAEHAQWAIDFVRRCVGGLARKFRDGVVGTGEARQEGELRKYIAEYARMTPEKRRHAYKVPAALSQNGAFVGMDYLRRRARRATAFTEDRRGLNIAIESSLRALERTGYLVKLSPKEARLNFGLTSDIYGLGSG